MPTTRLDSGDAIELTELLTLLTDWLAADPDSLGASLTRYVGHPAYGITELRTDLSRFRFLLGGDDGQALFGDNT